MRSVASQLFVSLLLGNSVPDRRVRLQRWTRHLIDTREPPDGRWLAAFSAGEQMSAMKVSGIAAEASASATTRSCWISTP
jgi:hypothetical protein